MCNEIKEYREFSEIRYFSLDALDSLNSLISLNYLNIKNYMKCLVAADTIDAEHLRHIPYKISHPSRHRIVIVFTEIKKTSAIRSAP